MSKKIKVGNAEIEKANYDYFLLQYSKMSKEYVIADLVNKCEDYEKLYNSYEKLEVEKIQKENIIKEVREYIERHLEREYFNYDILEANTIYNRDLYKVLKILDKENNNETI